MGEDAVFVAARVADETVSAWLPDHAVVVEGGRIAQVLPSGDLPSSLRDSHRVYELGDVSLLPGLVDAHAHMHCSATTDAYALVTTEGVDRLLLRAARNIRDALLSGVTTLRDLGSRNEVAFPVRSAVKAGVIPGPRLLLAGTPITTTAGHCHMFGTEADTADQVVVAVRRQRKLGADVIKIMATGGMFTPTANPRTVQYPVETLRAAVVEAERLDMQIVAHTLSAEGVRQCVDAGIHLLVHARWYSKDPLGSLEYDPALAARIVDNGQWVDPTFGHHLLGKEANAQGAPKRPLHWSVARAPVDDEDHLACARDMHERGVRFVTGLDMGMAHARFDSSSASARAFVKSLGFNEWEAIAASTKDTSEGIGLGAETGTLSLGKVADMVSVQGDPSLDISCLGRSVDVIQSGTPVKLKGKPLV